MEIRIDISCDKMTYINQKQFHERNVMINICIVDDNPNDSELLYNYLMKYSKEYGKKLDVKIYNSPIEFLENDNCTSDLLLLDVEMPGMDGLSTAREIRLKDQRIAIIFVTNMAQYAINGYEVNASDFIVKPVQYKSFVQKLEKALDWSLKRKTHNMLLNGSNGVHRVDSSDIYTITKDKNYLIFDTKRGVYKERGTISDATDKISKSGCSESFACISAGCLVNLEHVSSIGKDTVTVNGNVLALSRRMHKDFMEAFVNWGY